MSPKPWSLVLISKEYATLVIPVVLLLDPLPYPNLTYPKTKIVFPLSCAPFQDTIKKNKTTNF